jgi:hypothetical protein
MESSVEVNVVWEILVLAVFSVVTVNADIYLHITKSVAAYKPPVLSLGLPPQIALQKCDHRNYCNAYQVSKLGRPCRG